tara:strand:+ start:909 stop:1103 length:195 start_codon:yes stop_codon:yes gene_type:complete
MIKVQPKESYSVLGYGQLDKTKIYDAIIATNQPDYRQRGLIFVEANDDLRIELLLNKEEYTIHG